MLITLAELQEQMRYFLEPEILRRKDGSTYQCFDSESAHWAEDDLRERVLEAVAAGSPDAQAMAELVLRTSEAVFERWYA